MSLEEKSQKNHFPVQSNDPYSESEEVLEVAGNPHPYEGEAGEEEEDPDTLSNGDSAPLPAKDSRQKKKQKEQKKSYTSQFEAFRKAFEEQSDSEDKLQLAIDFMEASLAQGGTPHFRSFWEARRLCLPLFKENISPVLRSQLWTKYSEFSKEARRLKEIL